MSSNGWGYGENNGKSKKHLRSCNVLYMQIFLGPSEWHKEFPVAKEGKRQSPINIVTESVVESMSVTTENPLTWQYTMKHCLNVENTGTSWKVNVDGTGSSTHASIFAPVHCFKD